MSRVKQAISTEIRQPQISTRGREQKGIGAKEKANARGASGDQASSQLSVPRRVSAVLITQSPNGTWVAPWIF